MLLTLLLQQEQAVVVAQLGPFGRESQRPLEGGLAVVRHALSHVGQSKLLPSVGIAGVEPYRLAQHIDRVVQSMQSIAGYAAVTSDEHGTIKCTDADGRSWSKAVV